MNFEPTADYYGMDMSVDSNCLLFNYWEFIKNIVTLSTSAVKQKEIMGYGNVADEMAIDFDLYYTTIYSKYVSNSLLTEEQVSEINVLDKYLEDRSGDKMPDFWNDEILETHPDWKKVREMALNILKSLKYDNLEIVVERGTQEGRSSKNDHLLIVGTKTRLKNKNR